MGVMEILTLIVIIESCVIFLIIFNFFLKSRLKSERDKNEIEKQLRELTCRLDRLERK